MQRVIEILHNLRPEVEFTSSEDFICDGLLDSIDLLTLIREIESTFSISIDGAEITPENVKNLGSIRSLLERHLVSGLRNLA